MAVKKIGKQRTPRVHEIINQCATDQIMDRISRIFNEFVGGFNFLSEYAYGKEATFFGSARTNHNNHWYKEATKLAYLLSKDGYTIITGGGPGVMEAANKGAYTAGGKSLGLNIELPKHEQRINKYVKNSIAFYYFFSRKVMLSFASEVYIYFPGGFGTLDEFFEIVTLVQTRKTRKVPIVLVGYEYWKPLLHWIRHNVCEKYKAINKGDMKLYHLVDSAEEAHALIKTLVP